MTDLDWCYSALIAAGLIVDHFFTWPPFLRRFQIDPPSARLRLWTFWMTMLWTLTVIGIAIWFWEQRAWMALGFGIPRGWRLWGSVILIAGFAVLQALTATKIARITGPKPKLRARLGELAKMLPHSQSELRWFAAASLTAGFCEEFLFRGYLIWAFTPVLGWWGAAVLSLLVFAGAHAYQGRAGVLRAAIAGGLFTFLVVVSGSLFPAMVLHALIDVSSGVIAWLILREKPAPLSDSSEASVGIVRAPDPGSGAVENRVRR